MSAKPDNYQNGVPGVSLAALDAIEDQNTRQVLRALVDGWQVRNGASGTGNNRFITADEMSNLSGVVQSVSANLAGLGAKAAKPILTSAEINRIITDLQASVMNSLLWTTLGERIDLIDLSIVTEQQARIDAIASEAATRLGFDNVQGSKIATLETTTDNQATLITGLTTRVGGAESTIINLQSTTAAQAQTLVSLNTRTGNAESNIATLNTTTSNQANSLSLLTTLVSNNEAGLTTEINTRVNADNAIATSVATQFSTVNGNIGALQTTQTTLSNNVASLSGTVTALQSTVGQNTSAIALEAETRANVDGDMLAKYTVKIDQNGYVSGYGLMSTANNSIPFSEFIVRADRFAIGSPSGPGITPSVPFIVLTTPDSKGNQPGVYIDQVMIKNAAIGTAQIDDLAVNTLKIAGNAVTVPFFKQSAQVSGQVELDTARYFLEGNTLVMGIATGIGEVLGAFFGIQINLYLCSDAYGELFMGAAGASFENYAVITTQGSYVAPGDAIYWIRARVIRTDGGSLVTSSAAISVFGGRR
jgi:hypothetical protein